MKILITGASTGIGAETAKEMAPGNELYLHYFSSVEAAEAVAKQVESSGGKPHLFQADLREELGCRSLVDAVRKSGENLDVLVNNAGGLVKRQGVREYEWTLIQEIFVLNTFSAMMVTSLCLPLLEKGTNPSIVFLTSVAARTGAPSATTYAASKGALDTLTRGLASELAPDIRVNAVAPGVIETPFHEKVSTPERMKSFAEGAALKRNGKACHISKAVRFLVENDFMTGETIDINGGMRMR